jgi:hypothetical protein
MAVDSQFIDESTIEFNRSAFSENFGKLRMDLHQCIPAAVLLTRRRAYGGSFSCSATRFGGGKYLWGCPFRRQCLGLPLHPASRADTGEAGGYGED